MENQTSSKGIILNNGLYLGLVGVITALILYAMGKSLELQWVSSVVGFVATVAFIIFGIKQYKDANGGFISWDKALKSEWES